MFVGGLIVGLLFFKFGLLLAYCWLIEGTTFNSFPSNYVTLLFTARCDIGLM